jgi:hypothetical protein
MTVREVLLGGDLVRASSRRRGDDQGQRVAGDEERDGPLGLSSANSAWARPAAGTSSGTVTAKVRAWRKMIEHLLM